MKKTILKTLKKYYSILRMERKGRWKIRTIINCFLDAKNILSTYNSIKLISIEFHAFGETLPRLYTLMKDIEKKKDNALYVILPRFAEGWENIPNRRMMDLFPDTMQFIREDNIIFWEFIILFYWKRVDVTDYWSYVERRCGAWKIEVGKPGIIFPMKIENEGKYKYEKMQFSDPFICIHVRERGIKKYWRKSEGDIRGCDINTYKNACMAMEKCGITSVRMGKDEESQVCFSKMVNYAGDMQDDLMDFYLLSKCKFVLGTDSGLSACAAFFGRPVLTTNIMHLVSYWESLPYTKYDLVIPKKMRSVKNERYLNLREMLQAEYDCLLYSTNYRVQGIVIEDNTEKEIEEATLEMNHKLDGTWVVTDEEIAYMQQVQKILGDWRREHNSFPIRKIMRVNGYTMLPVNICYSYLKRNSYLLEG